MKLFLCENWGKHGFLKERFYLECEDMEAAIFTIKNCHSQRNSAWRVADVDVINQTPEDESGVFLFDPFTYV